MAVFTMSRDLHGVIGIGLTLPHAYKNLSLSTQQHVGPNKNMQAARCGGCTYILQGVRRADLRGDADGAGVGVALAHHDAAHGDKRRGGKAKLLGAQQGGHGEVAPRAHLAVRLQHGAAAQIVRHQCLVRLCQTQLPRQP